MLNKRGAYDTQSKRSGKNIKLQPATKIKASFRLINGVNVQNSESATRIDGVGSYNSTEVRHTLRADEKYDRAVENVNISMQAGLQNSSD